jgi:Glycosyltransferase family 9 (heptosyltransferase)
MSTTAARALKPAKVALDPISVCMPMGIGDCHWTCTKLRALSEMHGGRPIHAYVNTGPDHKSVGYLDLVPFVEKSFTSERGLYLLTELGEGVKVRDPSQYYKDARWSTLEGSAKWREFDYMLIANGHLESGKDLASWLPELDTEYSYPLDIPAKDRVYARSLAAPGSVLLYPSGVSANRGFHRNTWSVYDWTEVIERLNAEGVVPILVGAKSENDLEYQKKLLPALKGTRFDDTIGLTNIPQVLAMIEDAGVWCGLNSGLGIISAMRYTPTVMLWADSRYPIRSSSTYTMHPNMQRSWLREDQLATYRTLSYGSPGLTPASVVANILAVKR